MENTIELLDIISHLWPLVITIFVIVVIILKWPTLWNTIGNLRQVRIKAPGAEFELSATKEVMDQPEISDYQKTVGLVEPKIEDTKHSLLDVYEHLGKGEIHEAERIFVDVQSESLEEKRIENLIYYNYYKFITGIPSAIDSMIILLAGDQLSDHDRYLGFFYLGFCYKKGKQMNNAIESFNNANKYSTNEEEKIIVIINIAQTYSENSYKVEAILLLISNFTIINEKESKIKILKELATQYNLNENQIMQISCLEMAAQLGVNDTSILFDLAYAYSKSKFQEASIFHYSNLLFFNSEEPGALNNIGIGYKQKGLPITAVEYYKKAVEKENSLSAGNLAKLYIESGFETEARLLIEKFSIQKDVDPLLISAHDSLLSAIKKEGDQKNEINVIGFKHSSFFKDYAEFSLTYKPTNYSDSNWLDEDGNNINVTIKNDDLTIEWKVKNTILNDEDYFQIYGKINQGCTIIIDFPTIISPGLLSSIYLFDSSKKDKPYREIQKFTGYCSIDLDKGYIRVLYHKENDVRIKEIKKMESV